MVLLRGVNNYTLPCYRRLWSLGAVWSCRDWHRGRGDASRSAADGGRATPDRSASAFCDTSFGLVEDKLRRLSLKQHVRLLQGYFVESLSRLHGRSLSFVHLDCDLYYSYRTCLEAPWPWVVPGGVVLLDE